ncbi:MAG: family 78 glycoside hydrolase catalytic domain [Pirellulales bacterium]|nr:family 78 glycoside hydrolase catalytic domain [Pirellulales bacterium]
MTSLFLASGCTAWLIVATAVAASPAAGSVPAPAGLSCELLQRPHEAEIFDPRPEFSWECGVGERVCRQAAYQIVVRRVPADGSAPTVVWDSQRVAGDQSINVEYAGEPLVAAAAYSWQARIWNEAGTASDWSPPQEFRMARRLSERRTALYPLEQISQAPTAVESRGPGSYFVDFGRAAFGYARLRLPASDAARTIEVRFGEKLKSGRIDRNPGGSIRYYATTALVPAGTTELTLRPPRDRRNTTGAAIRLPASIGVVAPFRYLEVDEAPAGLAADAFARIAVQYPFDDAAARFTSSDADLNAVWDLCKYSIQATTFCGVYVDGDRERIPYEADAYINQLCHYGVDREFALARHSHEYLLANPTWPTEWKQHSILMAWADYLHTGDVESLRNHYDVLRREKLLEAAETSSGLLDTSGDDYRDIVDWPETERDGYDMAPINTVVNAFHYATLDRMARIAAATGHDADAERFARKARALHARFNAALWSDSAQRYVDGLGSRHASLHASLFPLAFGLVPPERRASVVEYVKSRQMACSVYPAQFLLEALYENDEADHALELMTTHARRGWINMIRSGSTITLEAWDRIYKPNLDWNHAWGAAPANLIPFYLVGVRPLEPGFGSILVQPRPGKLEWFESRIPSIRGPIDVAYKRSATAVQLEVVVPGNVAATVAVPLTEGAAPSVVDLDGEATPVRLEGRHAWLDGVGPGRHVIVLPLKAAVTQATPTDAR